MSDWNCLVEVRAGVVSRAANAIVYYCRVGRSMQGIPREWWTFFARFGVRRLSIWYVQRENVSFLDRRACMEVERGCVC